MRTRVPQVCFAAALLAGSGMVVSVSAQGAAAPSQQAPQVRRLSVDDAVRLALEHNLGIRIARFDPQIQDLNVLGARTGWTPTFTSSFGTSSTEQPPNSFLSGGASSIGSDRFNGTAGIQQTNRFGGQYQIGWDAARSTTNNIFTNFSPQVQSSLSLTYTQPLLRGWDIDNIRQQLQSSMKNREIADVDVREVLATTARTVRRSYWDLAYATANLQVQRQSLELARQSLRDTRARVEIGTTPPIDIVGDEAEVATREEAVIVAEAAIAQAEDTLRALVFDSTAPDFWTMRVETSDLPPSQSTKVDVETAVRNALDRRTDLQRARKNLELTDIAIRFQRNQTLPEATATIDYGLTGLGGTQFQRGAGFPGPIIGTTRRGFGSVLGDIFTNDFPSWTASVNISYPLGTSQQEATLARTRLQQAQAQTQISQQQLTVTTEVRQTARNVQTNQQRVQTSRVSRELAERRLEAEQRKLTAGTSTNFLVFQAQRDLAMARNNELRAILDYNQSVVDLETVQEVPLR